MMNNTAGGKETPNAIKSTRSRSLERNIDGMGAIASRSDRVACRGRSGRNEVATNAIASWPAFAQYASIRSARYSHQTANARRFVVMTGERLM